MLPWIIIVVVFAILLYASYNDIRTFEVPDWLNYSGIAAGLGINAILSVQHWSWSYILYSLAGFAAAFIVACIMYYSGAWGGGDAKLLMAMGALIGLRGLDSDGFAFLINLVLAAGIWGAIWAFWLMLHKPKQVFSALRVVHSKYLKFRALNLLLALVFFVSAFMVEQPTLMFLALLMFLLGHLAFFMKAVELVCMHKWVKTKDLVPGDWLVHTVLVGKEKITSGKVGVTEEQIRKLQKIKDKVLVRYGVPLVPAFPLAFAVTLLIGNPIFLLF